MLINRLLKSNVRLRVAIAVLVGLAVGVPLLLLATPVGSALHMPSYVVVLLGKYLCYALLAVAIDLIWGFCGILSLGHGAFFALGGYMMGMSLMHTIGQRGANALLSAFVAMSSPFKILPAFGLALFVPGVLAFIFGFLAFRSRVSGVYLSIITQALTFALKLAFFRDDFGFGGNTGLNDFTTIAGYPIDADTTRAVLFALSCLALAASLLCTEAIVRSKFGKVLVATRDAASRTRFVGYRVDRYQLVVFVISAMLAGLAGALYVPQVGIINPSEFEPQNSIEAVIWVAVGGRGTLVGAAAGAVLVNLGKTWLTDVLPSAWLFVLGLLFVLVTIALPKGLMGLIDAWTPRRRPSSGSAGIPEAAAPAANPDGAP